MTSLGAAIRSEFERLLGINVYPQPLPQGATDPALTYVIVSNIPLQSHSGDSGLWTARLQLDIWATDYQAAETKTHTLCDYVKDGRPTIGALNVQHARIADLADDYDAESQRYRWRLDLQIRYGG